MRAFKVTVDSRFHKSHVKMFDGNSYYWVVLRSSSRDTIHTSHIIHDTITSITPIRIHDLINNTCRNQDLILFTSNLLIQVIQTHSSFLLWNNQNIPTSAVPCCQNITIHPPTHDLTCQAVVQESSYQVTKLPSHQATKSPSYLPDSYHSLTTYLPLQLQILNPDSFSTSLSIKISNHPSSPRSISRSGHLSFSILLRMFIIPG